MHLCTLRKGLMKEEINFHLSLFIIVVFLIYKRCGHYSFIDTYWYDTHCSEGFHLVNDLV